MKKVFIIILIVPFLFISCKTFYANKAKGEAGIVRIPQFESNNIDQGTFLWSYYNANRRGSVMYVKDGKIRVLAENAPDVSLQTITEISSKADVADKVDAELVVKTQKTIAQLGKRTAAVNMLRDALYRLNEMYYASVDYQEELNKMLIKNEINESVYEKFTSGTSISNKTLTNDQMMTLFNNIIDKAKEISISESNAEIQISKFESESSIEESKTKAKKYELINTILQKIDGNISKEDAEKFLKQYLE